VLTLLLQRFQPLAVLADFRLTLLEPLLHAAGLLGLRVDQAARAFEFHAHLSQALARFREFGFGLIGLLAGRGQRLLASVHGGLQFLAFESGFMQLICNSLGFLRQKIIPSGEGETKLCIQLGLEFLVAAGLACLPLQGIHLAADLFQNVEHAGQILARPFELRLGKPPFGLEPADAGGLFDDVATVQRLGRKDLTDAALLDDGVGLRAEARSHEKVLDVAQPRLAAIDQVLALARTSGA